MRKQRNWLMGLGIGIILGATMLQLINFAEKAQNQGFGAADNEKKYTQQQFDEAVAKAVAEAAADPASTPTESGSKQPPEASASPSASPAASPKPGGKGDRVVALYVNSGMDLNTVAHSLQKLGVIEDAADFTDKASSVQKKIEVGMSTFHGKPGYKEIIAELTRPKDE